MKYTEAYISIHNPSTFPHFVVLQPGNLHDIAHNVILISS